VQLLLLTGWKHSPEKPDWILAASAHALLKTDSLPTPWFLRQEGVCQCLGAQTYKIHLLYLNKTQRKEGRKQMQTARGPHECQP
jgi:hypothetical protein